MLVAGFAKKENFLLTGLEKLNRLSPVSFFTPVLLLALVVRLPLLGEAPFGWDLECFKNWALRMADLGPLRFYEAGFFCDYPPFSLYGLGLLGKLIRFWGIEQQPWLFNAVIKLPAFGCDLLTAFLIYRLLDDANNRLARFWAVFYLFLPAVLYNSAFWGQVDSYFTFLVVGAFYLITKERWEWAAVVLTASVLTKAQTLAFLPVLLLVLVLKCDWRRIIRVLAVALTTFVVIILPFNIGKPLDWIFSHYFSQASLYPYATLNAANLFCLLGANQVPDSMLALGGLSYSQLGLICFLAAVFLSGYYYGKQPNHHRLAIALAVSGIAFFLFFPRMHERYLFAALPFLILASGYWQSRLIYLVGLILSGAYLLNMHLVVLYYYQGLPSVSFNQYLFFLALINTGAFLGLWLGIGWQFERGNKKKEN